jgi:tRNA nucleotidyltransferase (CCA-adding enzyme)
VERVHGSRDYFQVHTTKGTNEYLFEFIPVLDIASWEEAENVTDMSPLHVEYVMNKLAERPTLAEDIRLLKQFLKSAKIYGAESYIGGFSGHVVDILTLHYGGFHQVLEAAAQWKGQTVLDPEQHLRQPLEELNAAKTESPLVIVDPVQPDRNSAAALTRRAYEKLRSTAQQYLTTIHEGAQAEKSRASSTAQQKKYFTIVALDSRNFAQQHRGEEIYEIRMIAVSGKKDVIGAKCAKATEHIIGKILGAGFTIAHNAWEFNGKEALLLIAAPAQVLHEYEELAGPPVHMTQAAAAFERAHADTYPREGRLRALHKRKHRTIGELLESTIHDAYVLERVHRITLRQVPTGVSRTKTQR